MHSPLALRSKTGTAVRNWIKSKSWLVAVVIVGAAVAAYFERGTLHDWFTGPQVAPTILVSGNIEAHQSVLGFKTVQSRIVELPFDEGQWVDAGTLIARLDDSDYRQQVAITEAALDVQQRQLAAAEQNLIGVPADRRERRRRPRVQAGANMTAPMRCCRRVPAPSRRAIRLTPRCGNRPPRIERDQALRKRRRAASRTGQGRTSDSATETAQDGADRARLHDSARAVSTASSWCGRPSSARSWCRARRWSRWPISITSGCAPTSTRPTSARSATARARDRHDRYLSGQDLHQGRVSFISSNAEFTPKSVETHAERVTLVYRIQIDIDNPTHELVPGMPADAVLDALPPGGS